MLLPKRVARVLSSKVELAPDAGNALRSLTEKGKKSPIVIEKPQSHDDELIDINSGRQ
jgi:hypothetical protein